MAEASAPGSSANLGPAFDSLALALELRCRVEARSASAWTVTHRGSQRPRQGDVDRVLEAATLAVHEPLELHVFNEIPISAGLGSSAAAAASGAAAAWRTLGHRFAVDELFELVADIEGHPDNAAAATHGGLVAITSTGAVLELEISQELVVVLALPEARLATAQARQVLPSLVDREVTVRTIRRAVALVEGLRSGREDLLAEASGDELHEPARSELSPMSRQLVEVALQAGAAHACWSGAGPAVISFCMSGQVQNVISELEGVLGDAGRVMTLEVATDGLR